MGVQGADEDGNGPDMEVAGGPYLVSLQKRGEFPRGFGKIADRSACG
jgi:hypothetical protein